jgi:hypothetical protein
MEVRRGRDGIVPNSRLVTELPGTLLFLLGSSDVTNT